MYDFGLAGLSHVVGHHVRQLACTCWWVPWYKTSLIMFRCVREFTGPAVSELHSFDHTALCVEAIIIH